MICFNSTNFKDFTIFSTNLENNFCMSLISYINVFSLFWSPYMFMFFCN